jgi:hypothetical protein
MYPRKRFLGVSEAGTHLLQHAGPAEEGAQRVLHPRTLTTQHAPFDAVPVPHLRSGCTA